MKKILVVDDNIDTMSNIEELLEIHNYNVATASNGKTALDKIKSYNPDCVILDMKLPIMDGWTVMDKLKTEIDNGLIIIVITAFGQVSSAVRAIKKGAFDFIEKPFNNEVLLISVTRGLSNQKIKKELFDLKQSLLKIDDGEEIFGKSSETKNLIKQIKSVSGTDISILIEGETGSGKEIVADFIQRTSQRKNKQYIKVDCGAIPESLIESELFGFEKGAFTGAHQKKPGKFQTADGGTLFLDEIGNLPLSQQRRLLRVVEYKTITPLGSKNEIKINTRLICASNENLFKLVSEGKFREDLFYRLSEYTISVSPLRKRLDDIPHLAKTFFKEGRDELNSNLEGFSDAAIQKLTKYEWPGNVRQLRNIVRRAMLAAKIKIKPEDINLPIAIASDINDIFMDSSIEVFLDKFSNIKEALSSISDKFEKQLLEYCLKKVNGNISSAAKMFGINRATMYDKVEKYGLK